MAATRHVKLNSGWKKLDLTPDLLSDKEFESLISCKVITDYEIVDPKDSKKRKSSVNKLDFIKTSGPETKSDKVKKREKSKDKKKVKKSANSNSAIDISSKLLEDNDKPKSAKEKRKTKKKDVVKQKSLEKKGPWTVTPMKSIKDQNGVNAGSNLSKKLNKANKQSLVGTISNEPNPNNGEKKTARKRKQKVVESYSSERKRTKIMEESEEETQSSDNDKINEKMAAWKDLFVSKEVLQALCKNNFFAPTPIQAMALPSAIRDRKDVVGAAETGSGKTLAFGIPLIHNILLRKEKQAKHSVSSDDEEECEDMKDREKESGEEEEDTEEKEKEGEEEIEILNDDDDDDDENMLSDENSDFEGEENHNLEKVGDLGCVKVIDDADFSELGLPDLGPLLKKSNKSPLALILQPTRELAVQVKDHLQVAAVYTDITIAPILGGMSAEKQKRILKKCPDILVATPGRLWELMSQDPYLSRIDEVDSLVIDEADRMIEKGHFEELTQILSYINRNEKKKNKRQTFVFSATLTLVHSGPQRSSRKKMTLTEEKKLETLMSRIQMREKPKVIDLTRKIGTVETLTEARINCTLEEKDLYLYYFLIQYPGRTLVFANSKDCIRRLISIFTLLKTNPLPLHADMHQKQRLKNLEKFTANDNAVLLASDVAARGLDIPNVEHVIHYQVPQTVENYVHRSGRTARAMKEGLSVMLISPDDVKNYRKIVHTLNRDEDLPIFPVEHQLLSVLKKRLNLAKRIDTEEHRFNKKKRQNQWFEKAAREMDMLIDDEELISDLGDSFEQSGRKQELQQLRTELDQMLKQRLVPHTFSGKYLTQSGKLELPANEEKKDAIKILKKDKKLHGDLESNQQSKKKLSVKKKSKWKKRK